MINGLGGDEYIYTSGGTSGYTTISPQNPIPGSVKVEHNNIHVFDGYTWHQLHGAYATVGMSHTGKEIMEWARKKMVEERQTFAAMEEAVKMAANNPTVADALESYKEIKEAVKAPQQQAWEKLQAVVALCKEESR